MDKVKPYRILLVVRNPIGGIRTFLRYIYAHFDAAKYRFWLIAPRLPETDLLLNDLATLHLTYLPVPPDITTMQLLWVTTKTIRENRFEFVHSQGFTAGLCAIPGSCLKGVPHLLTLHETLYNERFNGLAGFLKRTALGALLASVSRVHCVSDDARHNLLEHLKFLRFFERRLLVIKTGIDARPFLEAERRDLRTEMGLPESSFLIGFLGRFMPEKGFDMLVDALNEIKNHGVSRDPIVLCFSQEDGFIREEKDNVKKKGLAKNVLFLPFVPSVASTLKGLDVVVMPSRREAAGLLAMETMVSGVPLVVTDCVGLREVARDSVAITIPTGDARALAAALVKEIVHPSTMRAQQFVAEAVRRFDIAGRAKELENVMLSLIEKG